MITIKKNKITEELRRFPNILYGAGFAGRQCRNILEGQSVEVDFFVDDDMTKWGRCIEGLKVCSYNELVGYCSGKEHVNVILTSIYGMQILKRVGKIRGITIYEMYDWYTEVVMPERFGEKIYDRESMKKYKENIGNLKGYLGDAESWRVLQNLYRYMEDGDINDISAISTEEEQYFIKEVQEYFGDRAFTLIDAGAYEGELVRAILEMELDVEKWFCFETNSENYRQLVRNSKKNGYKGEQVCINKGLWNESGVMHVWGSGTSSKVVEAGSQGEAVEMVTIDEYFKDIPVGLIKMDIEGAEMNALKGGMEVIKRDRPVLAVSIYHSIEDYYGILELMVRNLKGYRYLVRHHSMVFCETVLYAIPK